jgi:hypothetical protein
VFQDTRKPLRMWFLAMWFITSQKNGVSALGLQRVLGLGSYETAWTWLHKLRRAMVRPGRDCLTGAGKAARVLAQLFRLSHDLRPTCSVAKVDPLDGVDRGRHQPCLLDQFVRIVNRVVVQERLQFGGRDFQGIESGLSGNPYVRLKVACHRSGAVETEPHDFTLPNCQ